MMKKPYHHLLRYALVFLLLYLVVLTGCPYCRIFSFSCPGCGLTRAWLSFFLGDIRQAFQYNPFFLPAPLFIVLYVFRDRIPQRYTHLPDVVLFVFAIPMAVYHIFIR